MTIGEIFAYPFPLSGPVKINRDAAAAAFDGHCCITQHGSDFRFYSDHPQNGFKVTITAEDALWLIEELSLGAQSSAIFRRVVTWRKG